MKATEATDQHGNRGLALEFEEPGEEDRPRQAARRAARERARRERQTSGIVGDDKAGI